MRSVKDLTILLTGSNSGIGRATAHRFAERGAHLILHARTKEKAQVTRDEIALATGHEEIDTVHADLEALDNVRRMAGELRERYDQLDVLVNNAGLPGGPEQRRESEDGFERTFHVNTLVPFLLTHELMPLLEKAEGEARVVNVSSIAQAELDFNDLMLHEGWRGGRSYGQSKLALIMLTIEFARRHKGGHTTFNSLHPGTLLDTRMVREAFGTPRGEPEEGAEAIDHLATSDELDGVTGEYFDQKSRARAHEQAYDQEAREKLWARCAEMVGLNE